MLSSLILTMVALVQSPLSHALSQSSPTTANGNVHQRRDPDNAWQKDDNVLTSTSAELPSILPTPSANNTNTTELTPQNDLALSILANETSSGNGNSTVDDLVSKARGLLSELSSSDQYVKHENIAIAYCSDEDLQTVIDTYKAVQLNLVNVIDEIKTQNTRSSYGFKALFTSSRRKKFLQRIFEQMLVGAPFRLDNPDVRPSHWMPPPQRVGIVCVKDKADKSVPPEYVALCANPAAVVKNFTPWVLLCPPWFGYSNAPQKELCPIFSDGKASPDRMAFSQQSVMVHEFAHVYLGLRPYRAGHANEVYALSEIMGLSTGYQELNAGNYEAFYYCELLPDLNESSKRC